MKESKNRIILSANFHFKENTTEDRSQQFQISSLRPSSSRRITRRKSRVPIFELHREGLSRFSFFNGRNHLSVFTLHDAVATKQNPLEGKADLGSGWGTLVIALARKYPRQQVIGYELSWVPWLVSIIWKYSLRLDNLTLYRKDFKKAELSIASILFCYLFPGGMVALHEKLKRELINEILIVSNTFALPSCQPTKVIRLKDIYHTQICVYSWRPKRSFTTRGKNDDMRHSKMRQNT